MGSNGKCNYWVFSEKEEVEAEDDDDPMEQQQCA